MLIPCHALWTYIKDIKTVEICMTKIQSCVQENYARQPTVKDRPGANYTPLPPPPTHIVFVNGVKRQEKCWQIQPTLQWILNWFCEEEEKRRGKYFFVTLTTGYLRLVDQTAIAWVTGLLLFNFLLFSFFVLRWLLG